MSYTRIIGHRSDTVLSTNIALGAAVILAVAGQPTFAVAQVATELATAADEIIVTAGRREQKLEDVPYSISVVTTRQLSESGINDLQSLASNIPGLSTYDFGARVAAASTPNIRGINATAEPSRAFRAFEQSPVGTYIGNSPIEGYVQLTDLKQVEVLRGPQGTLYGAGALSGTIRVIPNAPELGVTSASVELSGGLMSHAGKASYSAEGMLNLPLGSTAALRVSAKYDYDPGFINAHSILQTTGSGLTATPVLADPGDVVNSAPLYKTKDDWNYQKSLTTRAALRWEPMDDFFLEASYLYARVKGEGGPQVNLIYAGGQHPFDPGMTLPAGGPYDTFTQVEQPFDRTTQLASLDMSYDAGFATLSSTTSYQRTTGDTYGDNSYGIAGVAGGAYLPYYAGVPTNPRFVYKQLFADKARTFSQEVRLVSTPGPDNMFDYTIGAFYQKQKRDGAWTIATPGSAARSIAQGCTSPVYYGSTFPECLVVVGPNDVVFEQIDAQRFTDISVFGELTWHFARNAQLIVGARQFWQDFSSAQSYVDYPFPIDIPATPNKSKASKIIGKASLSYEYSSGHNVYALWSQGFRRGGANSVPPDGIFKEDPALSAYDPDKTDNFEIGFKGRFGNGIAYSLSAFYIDWQKPQISASLPSGNLAVYNAVSADSKGIEFQSTGPLGIAGFSYNVGFVYSKATITGDYSLPANNGSGTIVPGLITGQSGQRLPGSPRYSANASIEYAADLGDDYRLSLSVNGVYRSAMTLSIAGSTTGVQSDDLRTINLLGTLSKDAWHATVYATNLFDRQSVLSPATRTQLNGLVSNSTVNRPREVGVRLGYSF